MRRAWVFAALLVATCEPVTFGPRAIEDAAIEDTLVYWDETVGYREPFTLVRDHSTLVQQIDGDRSPTRLGQCVGGHAIILYLSAIGDDYGCIRHTFTHELAHLHLTCSDADHTPTGLMRADVAGHCDDYTIDGDLLLRLKR